MFLLCDELVKVVLGCSWVANEPHAPTHMLCLPCSHRCLSANHEFLWPLTFKWDESKLPEFPGFHSHNDWLALEHVAMEHLNMPGISCWSRLPPESNTYSACMCSCDWALIRDLGKIDRKCSKILLQWCYIFNIRHFSWSISLSRSLLKKKKKIINIIATHYVTLLPIWSAICSQRFEKVKLKVIVKELDTFMEGFAFQNV